MISAAKIKTGVSTPAIVASRCMGLSSPVSGVLHDDGFDDLRHVFAPVDAGLHLLVDLHPLDDFDRVLLLGKELLDRALRSAVALLLDRLDLLDAVADALARLELRE